MDFGRMPLPKVRRDAAWDLVDSLRSTLHEVFMLDFTSCGCRTRASVAKYAPVDVRRPALDLLAQVLSFTPLATHSGSVVMSSCPPLLGAHPSDAQPDNGEPWQLETQKRGILVVTFFQGVFGVMRIVMGDVFGGIYAILLATLGYNSRMPGPAVNWLKTYVLITFINGTVGAVDLMQQALVQNYPILSLALPLTVNATHFLTLAVPLVSFSGAYFGWEYIKSQKQRALKARQQEQSGSLPWPPPELPPIEVLQQMQRMMDKAAGICPTRRANITQEAEEEIARLASLQD